MNRVVLLALQAEQDFTDAKQAHRDDDDVDTIEQVQVAEGVARRTHDRIDADHRDEQAERPPTISARTIDFPARPVTSDNPTSISEKNSGGPNFRASAVSGVREHDKADGDGGPPMNEPIAAIGERLAGPALLGHLVTVKAGDGRSSLTRHVDQY